MAKGAGLADDLGTAAAAASNAHSAMSPVRPILRAIMQRRTGRQPELTSVKRRFSSSGEAIRTANFIPAAIDATRHADGARVMSLEKRIHSCPD